MTTAAHGRRTVRLLRLVIDVAGGWAETTARAAYLRPRGRMTLVAQLTVNRIPMLIGDVLLSSETRTGLKVNLPLVGDINQILANRGFPFEVRFAQKLHVFEGRVAVGWSGPALQAKRALEVIAAISSRQGLTEADIKLELNAIDPDKIDQLQLVGLIIEDQNGTNVKYSGFSLQAPFIEIRNLGRVCGAGSGASAFFELLQKGDFLGQPDANVYQVAHGLLAALTNEEYRTGNTIANRWGGGFEALTFSPRSREFEKIGDILHTFWKIKEGEDDTLGLLPFFYKTAYWRDALVLRTAWAEDIRDNYLTLKFNDITLIPPLLKNIEEYDIAELGEIDFSYRAVCCHVLIEKTDGRDLLFIADQRQARQDIIFSVDQAGGPLQLTEYLPNIIRERLTFG